MKYDLVGKIKSYFESRGMSGFENIKEKIEYFQLSAIPELNGLFFVEPSPTDEKYSDEDLLPLVSRISNKDFELSWFNVIGKVIITSKDNTFEVSKDESNFFLQYAIENDIVRVSYDGKRIFVQIYTDVLKNGNELLDSVHNLVPDANYLINLEKAVYSPSENPAEKNGKMTYYMTYRDGKKDLEFPVYMSVFNIIRLISNVIREEYRKTIGLDKVQEMGKK